MKACDRTLWIAPLLIFCLGLLAVYSTTSAEILDQSLDQNLMQNVWKQVGYACAGLILGWCTHRMGYQRFLIYAPHFLGILTILLIITLIPGIGREVNGSRRWISFLGFSFQPSEFVKFCLPACYIHVFLKKREAFFRFYPFLIRMLLFIIPLLLILIEPNNGTVVVIGSVLMVLLLLTYVPFAFFAWPFLGFIVIFGTFASQLPYVRARLLIYWNPELDIRGKGHQPYQAKIAVGSGQFWGRGPGKSLQKFSYLPEAQNDYIGAIFAEEFGFLGVSGLIFLYLVLLFLGFRIAWKSSDEGGFLLAGSIIFLITFQAFLNLGVVSGLLPSTGLNLPLFSQGGTSLMANIFGLSLLRSIQQGGKDVVEYHKMGRSRTPSV